MDRTQDDKTQASTKTAPAKSGILFPRDDVQIIDLKELMQLGKHNQDPPARDINNQEEFDKLYGFRRNNFTLARHVLNFAKRLRRYSKLDWWYWFQRRMPILKWMISVSVLRNSFVDISGGVMVSIMCVPQALAYAMLVGVPPVYGLYTSFFGPLIYAVFGSSKHSSPGSFAIASLMIGSLVSELATEQGEEAGTTMPADEICCSPLMAHIPAKDAIDIATGVTFLVGVFQICFGLLNAGVLAVWLSDYLVQGLTTGAAVHVVASQMKAMMGVQGVPSASESIDWGLVQFIVCFAARASTIHWPACICSAICFVLLALASYGIDPVVSKWAKAFKFPMELLLVIFFTMLNYASVDTRFDLQLPRVGYVERGLAVPKFPSFRKFDRMWSKAMLIAVISFVIHIALAKLVSKKFNYTIDANQEWFALGIMHAFAAPFGCFAGGSSLGRTMTLVKLQTTSQLTSIVSALLILVVIFIASPLVEYLPKAVLAVIVVFAMKDLLLQVRHCYQLLMQSTTDFLIYFVTLMGVLFANLTTGLVCGVAFALLTVVFRSQWADFTCMGRIPGTFDFKGLDHYKAAEPVDGLIVFRYDAPIFFSNSETFIEKLYEATKINPLMIRASMNQTADNRSGFSFASLFERYRRKKPKVKTESESLLPTHPKEEDEIKMHCRTTAVSVEKRKPENVEETKNNTDDENVAITHVIIDCSCINYVDLMGKNALQQVFHDFATIKISIVFANVKASVRQFLETCDFYSSVPKSRLFVSVSDAVHQAQKERDKPFGVRLAGIEEKKMPPARSPQQKSPSAAAAASSGSTAGQEELTALVHSLEDTQPVEDAQEKHKKTIPKVPPSVEDKSLDNTMN